MDGLGYGVAYSEASLPKYQLHSVRQTMIPNMSTYEKMHLVFVSILCKVCWTTLQGFGLSGFSNYNETQIFESTMQWLLSFRRSRTLLIAKQFSIQLMQRKGLTQLSGDANQPLRRGDSEKPLACGRKFSLKLHNRISGQPFNLPYCLRQIDGLHGTVHETVADRHDLHNTYLEDLCPAQQFR